jgi:hypothetical protein
MPNGSWCDGATSTSKWRMSPAALGCHGTCSTSAEARTAARYAGSDS